MSKNYTVCSICGKHIEIGESGASKLNTDYNDVLRWYDTQYFCPACSKKIDKYISKERQTFKKRKRILIRGDNE